MLLCFQLLYLLLWWFTIKAAAVQQEPPEISLAAELAAQAS